VPISSLPTCEVDVREDDDHFYFVAELPGLNKDDVEVTLEDGVLTISGEKKDDRKEEKNGYHLRERRHGKFSRSFRLPTEVDPNKVGAQLKDGLLTVTLHKAEAIKPRTIEVKAG
jgi:HSP20 family protein